MMGKYPWSEVQAVVLCGGAGSRLWPLSRPDLPKPFIPLIGGRALLELTLERVQKLGSQVLIVTSETTRFLALQMAQKNGIAARLLLEDRMRNTAVAMTLAALTAQKPDDLQLFCPADHLMPEVDSFLSALEKGIPAARAGSIVTLGIQPDAPNAAYGYMVQGQEGLPGTFHVSRFIEKPDLAKAQSLLEEGSVLWNSGIFLCRADALIEAMHQHCPHILAQCQKAIAQGKKDGEWDFFRPDAAALSDCPSISFDKAVMEHHQAVVLVPYRGAWTDVGSWDALSALAPVDSQGNRLQGHALALQSKNTFVHAQSRKVVTLGTQDLIVVETPDAVLVSHASMAQDVRHMEDLMGVKSEQHKSASPRVIRSWGWYEEVQRGSGYRIKMLGVAPGAGLSWQSHQHRCEHWCVISGQATVRLDAGYCVLDVNQSISIAKQERHQLINRGSDWLQIIETQTGAYLEEDDITRHEVFDPDLQK